MSKFYVKVEDGKVVEGPNELSSSESDSPNINWGEDQLLKNNFILVDLTHDSLTEKIDYANPIVIADSVTYPIIKLSDSDRIVQTNQDVDSKRQNEYPTISDLVLALWELVIEGDSTLSTELQNQRLAIQAKYPKATK